jgi:GNAT superfamily N-acetyltransferase
MSRLIDVAARALQRLIEGVHSSFGDRCIVAKFNNRLVFMRFLVPDRADLQRSLDNLDTLGGTRLHDSLCSLVDYMCEHADALRPWAIVAVIDKMDNRSVRSADEFCRHVMEGFSSKSGNIMFVVSVGSDVDLGVLDSMAMNGRFNHVHADSFRSLDSTLMDVAFSIVNSLRGAVAHTAIQTWALIHQQRSSIPAVMDYAVLVNNSASMSRRAEWTYGTPVRDPVRGCPAAGRYAASYPVAGCGTSNSVTGYSVTGPSVKIRELFNNNLHPDDRQAFRDFAIENYPGINTLWEEGGIEFLVAVDIHTRWLVGLLVMLPYDGDKVHIRLMAVSKDYRGKGIGTAMLRYVAAKYTTKKVTLNVAFDRLELMEFYLDKGYAEQEEVSLEHGVVVLSLVHTSLFAGVPLPPESGTAYTPPSSFGVG